MSYESQSQNTHSNTFKKQSISQNTKDSHSEKSDQNNSNNKSVLFKTNFNWINLYGHWYSLRRYGYPLNMDNIKFMKSKPVQIPTIEYWNYQWQIEDYA